MATFPYEMYAKMVAAESEPVPLPQDNPDEHALDNPLPEETHETEPNE